MPSTSDLPDVSALTLEEGGKEEEPELPYCDRVVEKSKSDTCNYRYTTPGHSHCSHHLRALSLLTPPPGTLTAHTSLSASF